MRAKLGCGTSLQTVQHMFCWNALGSEFFLEVFLMLLLGPVVTQRSAHKAEINFSHPSHYALILW